MRLSTIFDAKVSIFTILRDVTHSDLDVLAIVNMSVGIQVVLTYMHRLLGYADGAVRNTDLP